MMSELKIYYEVEKLTDAQKIEYYDNEVLQESIDEILAECSGVESIWQLFNEFNNEFLQGNSKDNSGKKQISNYEDYKYDDDDKLTFYNSNKKFFLDYYDEDVFNKIVETATKLPIDDSKEYPDIAKVALVNDCIDKIAEKTNKKPKTLLEILEISDDRDETYEKNYPNSGAINSLREEDLNKYKVAFINECYFGNTIANYQSGYLLESLKERIFDQREKFFYVYNSADDKRDVGDNEGAINDYTEALEIDPKSYESYFNRGNAKKEIGDLKGAIEDYKKAKEIHPHLKEPDLSEAICNQLLKEDLEKRSDSKTASQYLDSGCDKDDKKDSEGAIKDYSKAIELDPNYAEAYANRGCAKEELGDKEGAFADWQKAADLGDKEAAKWMKEVKEKQNILYNLRPITDELRSEAQKIVETNAKKKEKYLKENLGGSISDSGVHSVANSLYGSSDFDQVLKELRFIPWDSDNLTRDQLLNLLNSNPDLKTYLEVEKVSHLMQSYNDGSNEFDMDSRVIYNKDEDGNVLFWKFTSKKYEEDYWVEIMSEFIDDSEYLEDENITTFDALYKAISESEEYGDS